MQPIKVNFKKDGKPTSTTINQNIAFINGLGKGLEMGDMDTYYKELGGLLNAFVLDLAERGFTCPPGSQQPNGQKLLRTFQNVKGNRSFKCH